MAALANYVIHLIFPLANMNEGVYTVDLSDWIGHINGNIILILLIVSVSLGIGLMTAGVLTKNGKKEKRG